MQRRLRKNNQVHRIISGVVAFVMIMALFIPSTGKTVAEQPDASMRCTILYFDISGLVYESFVEVGTALEDIWLPKELNAVVAYALEILPKAFNDIVYETDLTDLVLDENTVESINGPMEHALEDPIAELGAVDPEEQTEAGLDETIRELDGDNITDDAEIENNVFLGELLEISHITSNLSIRPLASDPSSAGFISLLGFEIDDIESITGESQPFGNETRGGETVGSEDEFDESENAESGNDDAASGIEEYNETENNQPAMQSESNESSEDSVHETDFAEDEIGDSGCEEVRKDEPDQQESEEEELEQVESVQEEPELEESEQEAPEQEETEQKESEQEGSEHEESEPVEIGGEESEQEKADFEINEIIVNAQEETRLEKSESGSSEANGGSTVMVSVPVAWTGYYNGNIPGTYTLVAQVQGYDFDGEPPFVQITVEEAVPLMQLPVRSRGRAVDYTIDIGIGPPTTPGVVPHPAGAGTGYTVVGATTASNRTIDFNTTANDYIYEIVQTGNSVSGFWSINLPTGVKTTVILNGINAVLYVHMYGDAELNLLLAGSNTISQGYITVREDAKITIDSADGTGSTSGSLNITSNSLGYAAIGGYYNTSQTPNVSKSGHITINGGTIVATHVGTLYPTAAVIGGAYGADGTITINGGSVTATALNRSTGAAIGGGQGATGHVTINGGTVVATVMPGGDGGSQARGGGAAIGGGSGGATSTSGNANVTIWGGHVTASAYNGAAIGGGVQSANATVNIHGGTIKASTSGLGAAIGGGGGYSGGSTSIVGAVNVNITNGDFDLKASNGAVIGIGGYQSGNTPVHSEAISGIVAISGGRIVADANNGNGVGTGWNNKVVPQLVINTGADIVVFGRNRTAFAGIYAGDNTANHNYGINQGDGYYVNLSFPDSGASMPTGTKFIIVSHGSLSDPIRTITAPFDIGMLSFTTGSSVSQEFNIFTQSGSGYKQLAHASSPRPSPLPAIITYNDTKIHSVKETFYYYTQGYVHDSYYRALPVKVGTGFSTYHMLEERYIDLSGKSIGSLDKTMFVVSGSIYAKVPPAIPGHTYKGYKWDAKPIGSDYTGGNPPNETILYDRLIYFVYDAYSQVDITISKTVLGSFANKSTSFTFYVYFTDSGNIPLPEYTSINSLGGVISGSDATAPPNYVLSLDANGRAEFTLKNGQTLSILNVQSNWKIKVIEAVNSNYHRTYVDSLTPGIIQTVDMALSTVGGNSRRFDFYNAQDDVVPTGIDSEGWVSATFAMIAVLLIITGQIALWSIVKKRKHSI